MKGILVQTDENSQMKKKNCKTMSRNTAMRETSWFFMHHYLSLGWVKKALMNLQKFWRKSPE